MAEKDWIGKQVTTFYWQGKPALWEGKVTGYHENETVVQIELKSGDYIYWLVDLCERVLDEPLDVLYRVYQEVTGGEEPDPGSDAYNVRLSEETMHSVIRILQGAGKVHGDVPDVR